MPHDPHRAHRAAGPGRRAEPVRGAGLPGRLPRARVLRRREGPERYCPGHAAWIRELAAAADLWWATGWGENANERYLPLLGVDPLPVVSFPPVPFDPELKVPAVAAVVGDRPAAWIDDNHTPAGRRWAAERAAPTLLVSIDPAVGWTRPDVDRVLAWAE
jgi:hypothetical protein